MAEFVPRQRHYAIGDGAVTVASFPSERPRAAIGLYNVSAADGYVSATFPNGTTLDLLVPANDVIRGVVPESVTTAATLTPALSATDVVWWTQG